MRNMRDMLGESGRTLSNRDREIMDMMMRRSDPVSPPQRMPLPDNEPRFETRSPENQMFSIENEISNLMKSYNMLVEAQEFGRAQEVANMIDQLQQQKIGIQAQRANAQIATGPMGSPIKQQDEITRILDSISI